MLRVGLVALVLVGLSFAATRLLLRQRSTGVVAEGETAAEPSQPVEGPPSPPARAKVPADLQERLAAVGQAVAMAEEIPARGELSALQLRMRSGDKEEAAAAESVFGNLKMAVERLFWTCWPYAPDPPARLSVVLVAEANDGRTIRVHGARLESVLGDVTDATKRCLEDRIARVPVLEGPYGPLAKLGRFKSGLRFEIESPCRTCLEKSRKGS